MFTVTTDYNGFVIMAVCSELVNPSMAGEDEDMNPQMGDWAGKSSQLAQCSNSVNSVIQ